MLNTSVNWEKKMKVEFFYINIPHNMFTEQLKNSYS